MLGWMVLLISSPAVFSAAIIKLGVENLSDLSISAMPIGRETFTVKTVPGRAWVLSAHMNTESYINRSLKIQDIQFNKTHPLFNSVTLKFKDEVLHINIKQDEPVFTNFQLTRSAAGPALYFFHLMRTTVKNSFSTTPHYSSEMEESTLLPKVNYKPRPRPLFPFIAGGLAFLQILILFAHCVCILFRLC